MIKNIGNGFFQKFYTLKMKFQRYSTISNRDKHIFLLDIHCLHKKLQEFLFMNVILSEHSQITPDYEAVLQILQPYFEAKLQIYRPHYGAILQIIHVK